MGYLLKKLTHSMLGKALGLRFAGDNHVVAVLSHGQYNRIEQGFFRINIWSETTKEPIAYTLRMGTYHVPLLTKDNFKVNWHIKVQFVFDLRKARNPSIACNFNETILQGIVGTRVQQALSLHVTKYNLGELNNTQTRQDLTAIIEIFVARKVNSVGIITPPDGVMLCEIDLPDSYHIINYYSNLKLSESEALIRGGNQSRIISANSISPQRLHQVLERFFSLSEIKNLCLYLDVHHDHIDENNAPDKARALIEYLQRRNRLPDLQNAILAQRPDLQEELNK